MAETAASGRQKLEVRGQKFKVSPAATFSNTEDNVCGMDTPIQDVAETAASRRQKLEVRGQKFKVSPAAKRLNEYGIYMNSIFS